MVGAVSKVASGLQSLSPERIEWIVLIEEVIFSLEIYKSAWIVYPAGLRHQMELLPHRAFCNYIFFSLDLKICPVQLFLINTHF